MSHEIEEHDKVFSVRQPSWHGLATIKDHYPTRQEAEAEVHDFQVIRESLYRMVPSYDAVLDRFVETYELVPKYQLNVRSDTMMTLASVPTERVDVQPSEVWDLAELIQGEDKNILVETAGSLQNGRKIWILLKLNEPIQIDGDPNGESLAYFALQNSYVPGEAFRGQATKVRIICANTSRASDVFAEATGVNFSFAHTTNLMERVSEIRDALAGWRQSIGQWKLAKEFMATQKVSIDGVNWFVDAFIPEPPATLTTDRVKANINQSRMELIGELYNPMTEGLEHTALGLFEAASSWNEHVRTAMTPLSRFKRAVLSPTDVLEQARELALEAVSL